MKSAKYHSVSLITRNAWKIKSSIDGKEIRTIRVRNIINLSRYNFVTYLMEEGEEIAIYYYPINK